MTRETGEGLFIQQLLSHLSIILFLCVCVRKTSIKFTLDCLKTVPGQADTLWKFLFFNYSVWSRDIEPK